MQEFEDLGPEYRQGTYLGRLPRELRQISTRYQESCDYHVGITIRNENIRWLTVRNRTGTIVCNILFERGIRNNITMKEFIFNVKQGIDVRYKLTSSHYIENIRGIRGHFGLYNRKDKGEINHYGIQLRMCREIEDALLELEAFQKS